MGNNLLPSRAASSHMTMVSEREKAKTKQNKQNNNTMNRPKLSLDSHSLVSNISFERPHIYGLSWRSSVYCMKRVFYKEAKEMAKCRASDFLYLSTEKGAEPH